MEITNSVITGNQAGFNGGGVSNYGTITITNSTITRNVVGTNYSPQAVAAGGGVSNTESSGRLTITNSTISDNEANGKNAGWGGGIWAGSPFERVGGGSGIALVRDKSIINNPMSRNGRTGVGALVEISNSTISGNGANRNGGGIYNFGPLHIINSTLSDNWANENEGGIEKSAPGIVELGNTVQKH